MTTLIVEAERSDAVQMRRVAELRPNPLNPRGPVDEASVGDLVESVRQHGILQALTVTPDGHVLLGHRRLVAARLAGLQEVPVTVREAPSPEEQLAIMLAENVAREDLTPLQEARAYRRMLGACGSRAEVARRVGVSLSRVIERLALLTLATDVQTLVERGSLGVTPAVVLAGVRDLDRQRRLATLAAQRRLSIRQLTELIKRGQVEPADAGAVASLHSANGHAKRPKPTVRQPAREEALAKLRAEPKREVACGRLAELVEGVCRWCGQADQESICEQCPLVHLANRVVK